MTAMSHRARWFELWPPYLGMTGQSPEIQRIVRAYQRQWRWAVVDGVANWCLLWPFYLIREARPALEHETWHGSVGGLLRALPAPYLVPVRVQDAKPGDLVLRGGLRGHAGFALTDGASVTLEGNSKNAVRITESQDWETAVRWWED